MRDALLIVWIALLGAERIDLFGGNGPIMLTPFLLLTPVVIAVETACVALRKGWFRLPRDTTWFFLVASTFLIFVLLSVFFSHDQAIAAKRYVLLFVQVYGILVVAVALANRPDPGRILVRGAYAGLSLFLLFNLLQLGAFLGVVPTGGVVDLSTSLYYGIIPRLTGTAHDPNQGGMRVVVFLFLILGFGRPSRARMVLVSLGVLSLLLTLSRSALLAAVGTAAFALLLRRGVRVTRAMVVGGSSVVAAAALVLLVLPGVVEGLGEVWGILGNRLTVREGSSSQHLEVLRRGWEVGTADVKRVLLGFGYGNAHLTLQDIFPGDKYGNYHSMLITFLAESGVFAMALALVLLLRPLLRPGVLQPLFAGYLLYNLFQQTHADPQFWLILALAWTGAVESRARARTGGPMEAMSARRVRVAPGLPSGSGRPARGMAHGGA